MPCRVDPTPADLEAAAQARRDKDAKAKAKIKADLEFRNMLEATACLAIDKWRSATGLAQEQIEDVLTEVVGGDATNWWRKHLAGEEKRIKKEALDKLSLREKEVLGLA